MFLEPEARPGQIEAISNRLDLTDGIERIEYLDQQAAFEEFKRLFPDRPDLIRRVRPEMMPPNFKVWTRPRATESVLDAFEGRPAVKEVVVSPC